MKNEKSWKEKIHAERQKREAKEAKEAKQRKVQNANLNNGWKS